jgi:hypothetical protein
LNSGVSVFNGERWKNYDVVDGPIGERVFDIQTCPIDGDVWIATSAGITRYKLNADEWEHFTREDGLLEDQASSLAFKKDGTLIVGTQCHGIAVFNRSGSNYKHSKNITAPERFGVNNCSPVPLVPEGDGLPTNQINQVIVASDSKIWIATPTGLVRSDSSLKTLYYVRGKDYADKVRGLYGGAPKDWKECPNEVKEYLLPEDYITCVAEDATGTIWLGTRRRGFMAIDPKTGRRGTGDRESMGMADNYVSSILPQPDGKPLIGLYIGGVIKPKDELRLNKKDISKQGKKDKSVAKKDFPKLPSTIKPPTSEELRNLFYKFKAVKPQKNPPSIIALNDDWRTQGDWIDRYGRHSGVLCAQAGGGFSFDTGYFSDEMERAGWIGKNYRKKDDVLRNWVHWLESNDKRVLQCLDIGGRKQAEWDDHKEVYPMTLDGPHIYATFKVPADTYIVSLYFFNKDGHEKYNRFRDYTVSIRTMKMPEQIFEHLGEPNVDAEDYFFKSKPGDKVRVRDFWGGVYKRFIVKVESNEYITLRIDSNYSFNTIISGIFFDCVPEMKIPARLKEPFPLRTEKSWELILNNPVEPWWWKVNALDQLLFQKDQSPLLFFTKFRGDTLAVIRSLVTIKDGRPCSCTDFDINDKELIRPDVATLLRAVQLYNYSDMVDYTQLKYSTYQWDAKCKLGRKNARDYKWSFEEFHKFTNQKVSEQTW